MIVIECSQLFGARQSIDAAVRLVSAAVYHHQKSVHACATSIYFIFSRQMISRSEWYRGKTQRTDEIACVGRPFYREMSQVNSMAIYFSISLCILHADFSGVIETNNLLSQTHSTSGAECRHFVSCAVKSYKLQGSTVRRILLYFRR